MKIDTIPAKDVSPAVGKQKYGDVYAALATLPPDQALRITFDSDEEAGKFRNAIKARYLSADGWEVTKAGPKQIAILKRPLSAEPPREPNPMP